MSQELKYTRAKYTSRLFAFAIDLFTMMAVTFLLVICTKLITNNTSWYKNINQTLDDIQERSHLYEKRDGRSIIITSIYTDPESEDKYKEYNNIFDTSLKKFYTESFFFDQTDPNSGIALYNKQRIPEGKTYSDLFVYNSEGEIVPSLNAKVEDLYSFYQTAVAHDAVAYMMENNDYMNASRAITLTFVFIELTIPIVISTLIFELLIPILDKHGKRTLGKRIFKLGLVTNSAISPSKKTYFLRYLVFLFIEVVLSVVTLLIPLVISFSMFAFSKSGQSLHDYILGTYVVDCSQNLIFKSKDEYYEHEEKMKNIRLDITR